MFVGKVTSLVEFLDRLTQIKWHDMFVPTYSLLEIVLRGSIIYLTLFAFLRLARSRHAGQMGLADILGTKEGIAALGRFLAATNAFQKAPPLPIPDEEEDHHPIPVWRR